MAYVLPNRKAFADSITRKFLKYRQALPTDDDTKDEDLCLRSDSSRPELFSYQKLVVDYLRMETPYRGLLLYHGLGSGKTFSSIGIAESLLTTKQVYIFLPKSLETNFKNEILSKGKPLYLEGNRWTQVPLTTDDTRKEAKRLGISDDYIGKYTSFYITEKDGNPNFNDFGPMIKKQLEEQVEDILNQRFKFIAYNGLNKTNILQYIEPESNIFDDSVVIIDEAHNFIQGIFNESDLKMPIYNKIYSAKSCKVVCLSGTPIINRAVEISFMMNLLRGPIERITVQLSNSSSWDEEGMTKFFYTVLDVDTVEYNSVKREIMLTRNPPNFETFIQTTDGKPQRVGVKYKKDMLYEPDIRKWISTWKGRFESQFAGNVIGPSDNFLIENHKCLPTDTSEFNGMFIDGLKIKNPTLFQRRIQGLVSYYKGADPRMLPSRLDEADTVKKIEMSEYQFMRYLATRWEEIQLDSRRGRLRPNLNEDLGSFRMKSRLSCNFAIPEELRLTKVDENDELSEDKKVEKPEILKALLANKDKYLTEDGLKTYSPKLLTMLQDLKKNYKTPEGKLRNQFVYSQYLTLEGLGVFAAVLDANGFQKYVIKKESDGRYVEDSTLDQDKPCYAFFSSAEDAVMRDFLLKVFNGQHDSLPESLRSSLKAKLCIMMASSAGAEGISLHNVRNVYVTEPYWNPGRIEQVIGRAIRICSHARLPKEERNVKVHLYMSVLSKTQAEAKEAPNIVAIRVNDTARKMYEGDEPIDTFMTSDEYLYEIAFEKGRIIKEISLLLKQSAIDCEIHKKLHSREYPVIQCMRFDSDVGYDALAFNPSLGLDEKEDVIRMNYQKRTRNLREIKLGDNHHIYDPVTREIFDYIMFHSTSNRLLRIGFLEQNKETKKYRLHFLPDYK